MTRTTIIALRTALVTMLATGLVYPLAVTGAAQLLFRDAADGSLVADDRGRIVGSELIGQRFTHPGHLHGRPSAAGADGYDARASSGSNLGPTSAALQQRIGAELERLLTENPAAPGPVPAELLTASGSGLDPHVSPTAAAWQVPRIAAARRVTEQRVQAVIDDATSGRELGVLGEPRVNVLVVNLALDRTFGSPE
jgi:K+-transporting ATPase ATPase C chain